MCCGTEMQALQKYPSLKAGLCRELENPVDPSIIADQDIKSFLRLMVGDSIDLLGNILLR
jgi:hypothetical protein